MIYANDDPMAILAMEIGRTGNYGDDYRDNTYDREYWEEERHGYEH